MLAAMLLAAKMWDDDCYESQDFAVLLGLDGKLILNLNRSFPYCALCPGARRYFNYELELSIHFKLQFGKMWVDDCYESQDFAVLLGLDGKIIIN